jgi:SAM-dependent methyltransferase
MHISNKLNSCPACKSESIKTFETIPASEIAKSMSELSYTASNLLIEDIEKGEVPAIVYIDKCIICGLEFANPMFTAQGNWYSNIENYYVIRHWDYKQCLNDLEPNSQILEIGCGEGHFLDLARSNGHSGIGLDFNHAAVQTARAKKLEIYCYNLKDIRIYFQNKTFDAVCFFHVIEHIDDLETFFRELSSIMNKGSSLNITCPNPNRWIKKLECAKNGLREGWDYPPHHQTRWNKVAINNILSRFGWKLKKYLEEPFDWRGVSTNSVSKDLALLGLNLSNLSETHRKTKIAKKMIQVFIPSIRNTGMNLYCQAVRN